MFRRKIISRYNFENAVEGGNIVRNNIIGRGIRHGKHYVVSRSRGLGSERVFYSPKIYDRKIEMNISYIAADTIVPFENMQYLNGNHVWLPKGQEVEVTMNLSFRVQIGCDGAYMEHIPAGAKVVLLERGSPQFPSIWGIINPTI